MDERTAREIMRYHNAPILKKSVGNRPALTMDNQPAGLRHNEAITPDLFEKPNVDDKNKRLERMLRDLSNSPTIDGLLDEIARLNKVLASEKRSHAATRGHLTRSRQEVCEWRDMHSVVCRENDLLRIQMKVAHQEAFALQERIAERPASMAACRQASID